MVEAWDKDATKPCPYINDESCELFFSLLQPIRILRPVKAMPSVAEVRKALLQDELGQEKSPVVDCDDGPTGFIMLGLEIESEQYVSYISVILMRLSLPRLTLQTDVRERGGLDVLQAASRTKQRLELRRKIERFRGSQVVHMVGLAQHLPEGSLETEGSAWQTCEDLPLHLPSSLSNDIRSKVCSPLLISTEDQLRYAHMGESLDEMRCYLRVRVFANQYKIKNVTGQRENTRARHWQKTFDKAVLSAKRRYRRAREAYCSLQGPGQWEGTYQVLKDEDVRAFNERALTIREQQEREDARRASGLLDEEIAAAPIGAGLELGEGRRRISWIWLVQGRCDEHEDAPAIHTGKSSILNCRTQH